MFDFEVLKPRIEAATKAAFTEMFQQHGAEEIYAFALYSDEGAMTVCPATNTVAFLNGLSAEEKKELPYYKFEPAEWKYEMVGADAAFNEISKLLDTELSKNNFQNEYEEEAVFKAFQDQLYSVCVAVLTKLKSEDFFKKIVGRDLFLLFWVSEYEFEKEELIRMVTALNNDAYKEEYLAWMKTWT